MSIFDNPEFFDQGFTKSEPLGSRQEIDVSDGQYFWDQILGSDDSNSTYHSSESKRSILECSYCKSPATHLCFDLFCTFECALAYSKNDGNLFDVIYNSISRVPIFFKTRNMPKCALDLLPNESYSDFWVRMYDCLYLDGDKRKEIMKTERKKALVFDSLHQKKLRGN